MAFCFYRHPHRLAPALLRNDAWISAHRVLRVADVSEKRSILVLKVQRDRTLKRSTVGLSLLHEGGGFFSGWTVSAQHRRWIVSAFYQKQSEVVSLKQTAWSFLASMRKLNVAAARLPLSKKSQICNIFLSHYYLRRRFSWNNIV